MDTKKNLTRERRELFERHGKTTYEEYMSNTFDAGLRPVTENEYEELYNRWIRKRSTR